MILLLLYDDVLLLGHVDMAEFKRFAKSKMGDEAVAVLEQLDQNQYEGGYLSSGSDYGSGDEREQQKDRNVEQVIKVLKKQISNASKTKDKHGFDFRKTFNKFDRDGSGSISADEFRSEMFKLSGKAGVTRKDINSVLKHFKKNDDTDLIIRVKACVCIYT